MKRSEVLKNIANLLLNLNDSLTFEEKADEILSLVENKGMLPPDRGYFCSCEDCAVDKQFFFEWEEE